MPVKDHAAEVALEVHTELGEGPVWDERSEGLLFVDILGQRVHSFWPRSGRHANFGVGRAVGAVVLHEGGGLVLAAHDAFYLCSPDGSELEAFGDLKVNGAKVRFNDGKVDPRGRFFAGTMDWDESQPLGCLYMLAADGNVSVAVEEVTVSNGLAWSADEATMYYIDSPRHSVDAFDFDPETGALSNRRVVAEVTGGSPDGMAIDAEGCLWVACWGGARVERLDPRDGRRLGQVLLPTSQVTSVAFGGPELSDLYVTTARSRLDGAQLAEQPHAGDLFVAQPGVAGLPAHRFEVPRRSKVPQG
ncbi:MAG: SMP-30/gluconolactonase/LRE family protein [Acidimicrobiales bacterium]